MPDLTERIRDAAAELPPTQQEMVLEFIQGLNRSLRDEEVAIGEAGAKLAVGAWPADDFSDWLAQSPPKAGKAVNNAAPGAGGSVVGRNAGADGVSAGALANTKRRYQSAGKCYVAPLTRTVHNIASEVELTPADGVVTDCVVSLDNVTTIPIST